MYNQNLQHELPKLIINLYIKQLCTEDAGPAPLINKSTEHTAW
jgi:hypothetical protein